jgi:hypothetical protein
MFDSNSEPKSFHETKQTQDSKNWWAAMTTEFQNMEQKKVWEVIPKISIPANQKVIGAQLVYANKVDGQFRATCAAKGVVNLQEKIYKRIMHQLYQTQHYTYS